MPRRSWMTAMLVAGMMLAGCVPPTEKSAYGPNQGEASFEAGVDRPPSMRTLYAMSRMMASQGRSDEQAALLRRVITEQPDFLPAYNDLAQLQLSRHDPQGALATLERAARVAPKDPVLANNIGMCHLFLRDYPAALECFERARSLAPRQGKYLANAALALNMLGRYDESLDLYTQVLGPARAHYNLGVMHQARRELLEALREYEQARQLESSATTALGNVLPLEVTTQPVE